MQILEGKGGPIAASSFATVPALLICSPYPSRWASRGVKAPGARVGLDTSPGYTIGFAVLAEPSHELAMT